MAEFEWSKFALVMQEALGLSRADLPELACRVTDSNNNGDQLRVKGTHTRLGGGKFS